MFLIVGLLFSNSHSAYAATGFPSGFTEAQFVSGLNQPTTLTFAPDGRLFILEKTGKVRIVKNGQLLSTPFLELTVDDYSEGGMIGFAFDPNFATNRYVYLHYSVGGRVNRVSRFRASASNPDVVEANSETHILTPIPNAGGNHNGGDLHFGPDGKLYIAVGDGGQTAQNAQNLTNLNGKILRINSDGTIPNDNPFSSSSTARKEIWAYGLRNPYRFAFRPGTSTMYINDVGQSSFEEINQGQAGGNFGWPTCEGTCSNSNFINPLHAYSRSVGASITGGTFYTATQFPQQYQGQYFFGDYVSDWIKIFNPSNQQVTNFANNANTVVDIKVGPDGALYYASIQEGRVYKVSYGSGATATPSPSPSPTPSNNQLPNITFTSPQNESRFNAGNVINYAATATDPEDGTLPASAFSWTVIFHHDTHTHPFLGPLNGQRSGAFTIPKIGETSANIWYSIQLTVKDSKGAERTMSREIYPNTVNLRIETDPPGVSITLDGQPQADGYMFESVVGFTHSLSAPGNFIQNGQKYIFQAWSDGGSMLHSFDTPAQDQNYIATFIESAITACDADINSDSFVDITDYSLLVGDFLETPPSDPKTDINQDNITDITDYSLLVSFFLETCSE